MPDGTNHPRLATVGPDPFAAAIAEWGPQTEEDPELTAIWQHVDALSLFVGLDPDGAEVPTLKARVDAIDSGLNSAHRIAFNLRMRIVAIERSLQPRYERDRLVTALASFNQQEKDLAARSHAKALLVHLITTE